MSSGLARQQRRTEQSHDRQDHESRNELSMPNHQVNMIMRIEETHDSDERHSFQLG
jgi:hypothetical protein